MRAAVRPAARWLPLAGAVYVLAWLVGLVIAPAAPNGPVSDAVLHAHYAANTSAVLVQSLLVHGVAGIALALVAIDLGRRSDRSPALLPGSGLTAAALSLAQVAVLVILVGQVDVAEGGRTAALAGWIDRLDGLKLLALAALTGLGAAIRLPGRAGRVVQVLGRVLAPLLVLGAVAVGLDVAALTPALYLSLPLLLAWVGLVGVSRPRAGAEGEPAAALGGAR